MYTETRKNETKRIPKRKFVSPIGFPNTRIHYPAIPYT